MRQIALALIIIGGMFSQTGCGSLQTASENIAMASANAAQTVRDVSEIVSEVNGSVQGALGKIDGVLASIESIKASFDAAASSSGEGGEAKTPWDVIAGLLAAAGATYAAYKKGHSTGTKTATNGTTPAA